MESHGKVMDFRFQDFVGTLAGMSNIKVAVRLYEEQIERESATSAGDLVGFLVGGKNIGSYGH